MRKKSSELEALASVRFAARWEQLLSFMEAGPSMDADEAEQAGAWRKLLIFMKALEGFDG